MAILKQLTVALIVSLLIHSCTSGTSSTPTDDSSDTSNATTSYGRNTSNQQSILGSNVAPFGSNTPGYVLIDFGPKMQSWTSNICNTEGFGNGPAIALDDNQWPQSLSDNQCLGSFLFNDMGGHYPEGTYVILWEGEGSFLIEGDTYFTHTHGDEVDTSGSLRRSTFTIDASEQSSEGLYFNITSIESEDPLRNFRIIAPGGMCGRSATTLNYFSHCATERGGSGNCAADESCFDFEDIYFDRFSDTIDDIHNPAPIFHPTYLASYQPYRAIRFMKWSRVEDIETVNWNDRIQMRAQSFTGDTNGLPFEYMVAMSNILNSDIWLNIPVQASEDFIENYANLVANTLQSNLTVYIEYANELWNNLQAAPYPYLLNLAESNNLIPSSDTDIIKVAKQGALQSVAAYAPWSERFSEERLIRVAAGFLVRPDVSSALLDFQESYTQFDALAVGAYFGPDRRFVDDQAAYDSMSLDDIFSEISSGSILQSGTALPDIDSAVRAHQELAETRNLLLIAYEGGQTLTAGNANASVADRILSANRDPRMADIYSEHLEQWFEAGGQIYFHFLNEDVYDANGAFGLLEYQNQNRSSAPKYDAVLDFIEANPCTWDNCTRELP